MNTINVQCIFDGICRLAEGPIWNVKLQKLFWTDIFEKRLWVYDPCTGKSQIFWEGEHMVGGCAFTRKGNLVLCTDKGIYLLETHKTNNINVMPRKLLNITLRKNERFNDIIVDPKGRIYAGTWLNGEEDSVLYKLEKNKTPIPVVRGIGGSNGMAFSMDEHFFYHTDSRKYTISRYKYYLDTGEIAEPEIYYKGEEKDGVPDGITIDAEDYIWVAFWGTSVIRRFSPKGKIDQEIPLPAKQPTSVTFGGKDLRDLYITTASEGAIDVRKGFDKEGGFLGGNVYKLHVEFSGRADWPAGFD